MHQKKKRMSQCPRRSIQRRWILLLYNREEEREKIKIREAKLRADQDGGGGCWSAGQEAWDSSTWAGWIFFLNGGARYQKFWLSDKGA